MLSNKLWWLYFSELSHNLFNRMATIDPYNVMALRVWHTSKFPFNRINAFKLKQTNKLTEMRLIWWILIGFWPKQWTWKRRREREKMHGHASRINNLTESWIVAERLTANKTTEKEKEIYKKSEDFMIAKIWNSVQFSHYKTITTYIS